MTADSVKCCDATANESMMEIDFMLDAYERRRSPTDTGKKAAIVVKQSAPKASGGEESYSFSYDDIVWRNVIAFIYLHLSTFYAFFLVVTGHYKLWTLLCCYIYGMIGAFGITAGAHRLWAHSAYKAKRPLRIILMVMQTIAFQNCVWEWVRDHRVHHKYTDTNADPHNYSRGFFFAHMGWLMVRKHPLVKQKGAGIDLSDIERDPVCRFQKKYYTILMPLLAFVVPICILYTVQGSWSLAVHASNMRYFLSLHYAWLVNSAAHFWGDKPFDKAIKPTDNKLVAFVTIGEGWHNYHHVFPWDYKAAELGNFSFNPTTTFIDFFAWLGWAYDMKVVSNPMICKRALRTGDGTYDMNKFAVDPLLECNGNVELVNMDHQNMLWGWNDKDLPEKAKEYVEVRSQRTTN